jgi:uncharacterized protein (DUF2235 family)
MAKNIILFSDGTGNAASSFWRTNVWRMFQAVNLAGDRQVARYDDGVGTSSFLPLAIIGGAFGYGLKRNVIDLYEFVCRNYSAGDRIYVFGFSRGAFTVRVLVGFILQQGLVPNLSEGDMHARAKAAYRAYRAWGYHSFFRIEWPFRKLRDGLIRIKHLIQHRPPYSPDENRRVESVEFMGVWDTVAAYGLPIDEMTRGVDRWLWPLVLPNRELDPRVRCARHALALDDERTTFHPMLWTETGEQQLTPDAEGRRWIRDERLSQVWFVGMHSNVGGGYPDDSLANIPLYWMMEEARRCGLDFKTPPADQPDGMAWAKSAGDKDGRLYDSRSGVGGYYRYGPRRLDDLCHVDSSDPRVAVDVPVPKIHESVFRRIQSECNPYAPIGLSSSYSLVMDNSEILAPQNNPYESAATAAARYAAQQRIWNFVWLRRIVYFLTVAASYHLLAFFWFHEQIPEHEFDSSVRLVSEFVRLVESFLPRPVVHWWTDAYAASPEWFLGGIVAVAILIGGSSIGSHISSAMRLDWITRGTNSGVPDTALHRGILAFRTSDTYQAALWALKWWILPALSAVFLIWLGFVTASHLLFNVVDSMGFVCDPQPIEKRLTSKGARSNPLDFDTKAICVSSRTEVEAGKSYRVTIEVLSPWADGDIPATPAGFRSASAPEWWRAPLLYAALPLRRVLFRPWFLILGRIGPMGNAEYFLDPVRLRDRPNVYQGSFVSERSGELFFYVNESVIALPFLSSVFYDNNKGKALITVEQLEN